MIWVNRRFLSTIVRRQQSIRWLKTEPQKQFDSLLSLTDSCRQRLEQIRASRQVDRILLRLSVTSGGCEGFSYSFSFVDPPIAEPNDHIFGSENAQVVIDQASLDLVKGSTIDYTQEMIRSAFTVIGNPNSESSCGCGSSFSPKF